MTTANVRSPDSSGDRAAAHAARQSALYGGIWAVDAGYGTREEDVLDTVHHRIGPHMLRLFSCRDLSAYFRPVADCVIDFGAGDGRFLHAMWEGGFVAEAVGVDLHRPDFLPDWLTWQQRPMWEPLDVTGDYAISTDALEHLPPDMVPATLANIAASAPHGFLRISTKQDIYGTERGLHLHETVEPPEWWLAQCEAAGIVASSWRVYRDSAIEVYW